MTKTTSKRWRRADDEQLDLFAWLGSADPPSDGSLNIGLPLRQALSEAIRQCGIERIDLCASLYKLTGVEVSKATLDSWSAESRDKSSDGIDLNGNKRWGIPAEMIPAFCAVTGSFDLLALIAEACQHKALKGKDVVRARLGRINEDMRRMAAEKKRLEQALVSTD
jgi:hypothetical protein